MKVHSCIIERFTGPAELARVTGMTLGAAKQTKRRGSIAPRYWRHVVEARKATLEELAQAASRRSPKERAA